MSQARVQKFRWLSAFVISFLLMIIGAIYFALSSVNTTEVNAADPAYAGTLKITKNYYESFESALLLPVDQVYAGDDILYILKVTNISSNPESRFGGTINIDDELSPDVMGNVHVENIIINTTWLSQSQIDGACSVNNSYVLHCSLSADLFSANPLRPSGLVEADSIEIRVKAKATVRGTSDSYQLHNRAYVYSGDDLDPDGPDCKTLADAKKIERCHSEDVIFCVVMPKIEIDKKVNKDGRVTCYYYATPENAKKGGSLSNIYRNKETNQLVFPSGQDQYLSKKDITESSGTHESNCMNNDGGTANFTLDEAISKWNALNAEERDIDWINPQKPKLESCKAGYDTAQCVADATSAGRQAYIESIRGQVSHVSEATNGYVDDQSVRAGERIEYTLTVRNTGSAVTKGGATDGIYIYDQFDPLFFENDDIYVQPLTGGVTCKVEQAKLTCYTNRPLAPFSPLFTERNYTELEAFKAWDELSSSERDKWITEARNRFIEECTNNTAGQIATYKAQLAREEKEKDGYEANLDKVVKDLAETKTAAAKTQEEITFHDNLLKSVESNLKDAEDLLASIIEHAGSTKQPVPTDQVDTLDRQIKSLKKDRDELKARLDAHKKQAEEYKDLIVKLEKQETDLIKQIENKTTDIVITKGILNALEVETKTCEENAEVYTPAEARKNFIEWKMTQKKPSPLSHDDRSPEDCIANCNPDEDPSGYYMNGQYGLGSLVVGDEIVIRISVIPRQTGEIKNIAYVGGGGDLLCPKDFSTNSFCHSEWVSTFVTAPELHINKELRNGTDADMGVSIVRGTEAKYIIKVTNEGTANTKGMIVIRDVIPEYLEVNRTTLALAFDDGSYSYETGFCEFRGTSARELYCRAYDTVEGGLEQRRGVWTIEFNVRVTEDADIDAEHNKVVNYAYVYGGEDPVCSNEQIMLTINEAFHAGDINPYNRCYDYLGHSIVSPKLHVTKGVDKMPTNHGEKFNYWVTVENKGDYPTTADTTVLDHLPENVSIETRTLSSGCAYEDGSGVITCTVGTGLKAGHKETFKYSATSTNLSGQVVNRVTIFNPDDGDCSNDAAALNTSRCHATVSTSAMSPILQIETSASALEVYKGGQLAYLTTVRNIGNSQTTANSTVTVRMPNELRLLGVRASNGTCRVDLHYFECNIPAGIQPGQAVYISTLTQAREVTDADTILHADVHGGGDPGCVESAEDNSSTSSIFGSKVFANDATPTDADDEIATDLSDGGSDDSTIPISPDATIPTVTPNGQTITPAEPSISTEKRCLSQAGVRIIDRPAWATDIDDNGTGIPDAGLLSTMQALGTISMLGVASYMVLKSRKDFTSQAIN